MVVKLVNTKSYGSKDKGLFYFVLIIHQLNAKKIVHNVCVSILKKRNYWQVVIQNAAQ